MFWLIVGLGVVQAMVDMSNKYVFESINPPEVSPPNKTSCLLI